MNVQVNSPRYQKVHKWLYRNHGKAIHCSNTFDHSAKRYEWSNISGKYLFDITDWKQLCPSCHRKMDYTEKTRIKQRISNKGKSPVSIRKKVKQYLGNRFVKEYESISEAGRQLGILKTSISNVLAGRAKTAGKARWYFEYTGTI